MVPKKPRKQHFTFIELFAGIGGFRAGLEPIGGRCVWANEWDEAARRTYAANWLHIPDERDIRNIDPAEIPPHDWLVGGWPCQPWSRLGKRLGLGDARGQLIFNILSIAEHHRPKVILLENVPRVSQDPVIAQIEARLAQAGYQVHHQCLDSSDFGLAQRRKRLFIVALRKRSIRAEFEWPKPHPKAKSLQSILQAKTEIDPQYILTPQACVHVFAAQKAGQFRPQIVDPRRAKSSVAKTLTNNYSQIQKVGTYLRYGRTGLRRLTLIECRRLTGLPHWFGFPVSRSRAYNQLGNAVCPPVVRAIATQILKALRNSRQA